jgi:hypothetical protein
MDQFAKWLRRYINESDLVSELVDINLVESSPIKGLGEETVGQRWISVLKKKASTILRDFLVFI